jgi:hypothetical protein
MAFKLNIMAYPYSSHKPAYFFLNRLIQLVLYIPVNIIKLYLSGLGNEILFLLMFCP